MRAVFRLIFIIITHIQSLCRVWTLFSILPSTYVLKYESRKIYGDPMHVFVLKR